MIYVVPEISLDIKISKKGYEDKNLSLHLQQDDYKKLEVKLNESRGFVIFKVNPKGALINIGDRNYRSAETVSLLSGRYSAKVKRSGYLAKTIDLNVQYNQHKTISVRLEPKTTADALKRSFVPGWGQFYQEKTLRGWLYPLLFAGAAAGSYLYYEKYNDDLDAYNLAAENYRNAFDEDEILYYRKQMDDAYDTAVNTKNIRNGFYISAAVIYLWNIADVLLLTPAWERRVSLSVKTDGRFYSTRVSVLFK